MNFTEGSLMSERFADLFEKSVNSSLFRPGAKIKGTVVHVGKDKITIDAGLKSEGIIPTSEFYNQKGEVEVSVNDEVEVFLETVEDGNGATILSREKAKRAEAWEDLIRAYENKETVKGLVINKVKGGLIIEITGIRGFLPGSQMDVKPAHEVDISEGDLIDLRVINIDDKRSNIVVSRRAVIESETSAERQEVLSKLEIGQEVEGVVKNITDYGAFVDLGGIDGLLHITDMSWTRINHPTAVISLGDSIKVKVLSFDKERSRVSLGLKQMGNDPWHDIKGRFPLNSKIAGKISNIADYGCFVELSPGIEGLVHVSEMDWTNKNVNPNKLVQLGQEVEVMVLDIDEDRRRISLGLKQCQINPWQAFAEEHQKGEHIKGQIQSITDFGIFLGLEGGIDGLVHVSDISWKEQGEQAIRNYKKGQEIETVILGIEPERERISLGIKQLESDPFESYVAINGKGSIVTGKVVEVQPKEVTVELATEVLATMKAYEISRDEKIEDASEKLSVGDEVEARITNVDKKNRTIQISVRAKDVHEEKKAIKEFSKDSKVSSSLGDFIKQQIDKGE